MISIARDLREAIDTYEELLRMHQLNLELLETLELSLLWVQGFSKNCDVSIPNKETLTRLLTKTSRLIEEISATNPIATKRFQSIRRKKTPFKSDVDEPEPVFQLNDCCLQVSFQLELFFFHYLQS